MVKACIIIPPSPYLDDDMVIPHQGALYIKRYVEENSDHIVDILFNPGLGDISEYLVVGFTSATANIKYVEEHLPLPNKITVLGGPHVTFYRDDLSPILQTIDHLVPGDGCKPFLSILNALPIKWEHDDKNQMPYRGKDVLDQLTYYMYDLKATTMITSRGCPNRCYFCESANTHLRFKDIDVIEQEIMECADLGYGFISISDDMFCIRYDRVKAIAEIMNRYNMKFRCLARANTFTGEMAKVLSENGCLEVGFGAESGSPKILVTVNKNTRVWQIKRTIDLIKDHGMFARASFIIGLPCETRHTVKETYNLIKKSRLDDFVVFMYHPYRGTYIYDNISFFDLELPDGYDDTMHLIGKNATAPNSGVRTRALSAKKIAKYHEKFRKLKLKRLKNAE